jgi:hypothetical protein
MTDIITAEGKDVGEGNVVAHHPRLDSYHHSTVRHHLAHRSQARHSIITTTRPLNPFKLTNLDKKETADE